jgi:predicted enzyme related to lactoylglutathione lyase
MPTRDHAPIGAPCWIELWSSKPEEARAFYAELFGWTWTDPDEAMGGYFNSYLGEQRIGGGMHNDGSQGTPDGWFVYLTVEDADAAAEACTANGGTVVAPPMDVMDMGRMAVFLDPAGLAIGAWQPGTLQGFGVYDEANSPAWCELHTRDFAGAMAFYAAVFGSNILSVGDEDVFRYSVFTEGEEQLAGVMDASIFPEDAPLGWSVYFGSDDAAATTAKAEELGAKVTIGPDDTPYGVLVGLDDPTGIPFKLRQSPQT